MGWTQYHATHYNAKGQVDRKAEMDELHTFENNHYKSTVIKSKMVGRIYYAAVELVNKDENDTIVYASVAVTGGKIPGDDPYFNFGYKGMTESWLPVYCDCPKSILDLLTPTTDSNSLSWRNECRKRLVQPKLADLPVGTTIKYERHDGTKYTLKKMSPNSQFKRCWWWVVGENSYMPARRIPDSYEIVN